ncbi:MAG TPA: hypothetical protein PJ986_15965 [Gammaproteobacteria bacterium]|nr:hypothetical protein [Gammaproteobacteria bacterium]
MPARRTAAGLAVAAMMIGSFAGGIGLPVPAWWPGACAWLAGALLLPALTRFQAMQAALMSLVGILGIAWAGAHGDRSWWPGLRDGNHALLAMLAAVSFLRPVTASGVSDEPLPRGRRAVLETLAATHLFGAVINISAPVLVGERIAPRRGMTPLQAKTISRAFVAASMWSPFFIAMALILHYVPNARLPVISGLGFTASALMMAYCAVTLTRDPSAADFTGYPLHWRALWPPVLLSACVLSGHALLPELSVLVLIEGAALGVTLAVLLLRRPRETGALLARHVRERLPDMRGEFAMFLGAAVMTAGIGAAMGLTDVVLAPTSFGPGTAAVLLAALILLAVIGVHPVVCISVLAGLWPFARYDGNLLGAVFLLAWGLGLVISPFSGTSLVFQGRFGLRTMDLLRFNLAYVGLGYGIGVALLYGYARWAAA